MKEGYQFLQNEQQIYEKMKLMVTIGLLAQTYGVQTMSSVIVVELSTSSLRKQGDHFCIVNTLLSALDNKLST